MPGFDAMIAELRTWMPTWLSDKQFSERARLAAREARRAERSGADAGGETRGTSIDLWKEALNEALRLRLVEKQNRVVTGRGADKQNHRAPPREPGIAYRSTKR